MRDEFQYADLHCHPNLKAFGHSFTSLRAPRSSLWYDKQPGLLPKLINLFTGITRVAQSNFTAMSRGGARIVYLSLYPFEKGFYDNIAGNGPLSAFLSDLITGVGYKRLRSIQKNNNYFDDLVAEYDFIVNAKKNKAIDGNHQRFRLVASKNELLDCLASSDDIAVVLCIEGAHVFNSGLTQYGHAIDADEILRNIQAVKDWTYSPFYITFAHNFYNDLCGHCESLQPIRWAVDQSEKINTGFTRIGRRALHELLSDDNGPRVLIDIKHMSYQSRREYFDIIHRDYETNLPPTLVSHGAATGLGDRSALLRKKEHIFDTSEINFYDWEIQNVGRASGLFAIQFDARRIARRDFVRKQLLSLSGPKAIKQSAWLVWQQMRHIAEILDKGEMRAWDITCLGSDYDGTIDPLPGVWTVASISKLEQELLNHINQYLKNNCPLAPDNRNITPEEILKKFFVDNIQSYTTRHLNK